jgi:hypothetical protein
MKTRIALLLILLILALLATSAAAFSTHRYQIEAGTISGGAYQLTSFGTQADYLASRGKYRLLEPLALNQRGSGCCCTYLPCILRVW